MSNADDDSDGKRPLIPLRIPASLLSTLSSESQITLNHNSNDNGDVESLTVTQSKSTKDEQQTYPLEVTNSKQSTDWYTSTANTITADSSLSTSNKKELQHIGTSTKQYTIKISKPKSNNIKQQQQNVKEIGKRTRRLLEEERAKRKEIVRLDYDTNNTDLCLPPLPEEKAAAAAEKQQQQQSTEKIKVSQNKSTKLTTTIRKRKRKVASNIDGYMPNIDHLLLPTDTSIISKDDYSNIIRLHGLPINVKPEHIYKFFHGLNPSLIFILPRFDCYIQGWDAIANNGGEKNNNTTSSGILVERHASNFRVYVKFTSSLVANAAIERMGESIGLADRGGEEDGIVQCGKRKIVGASIAMSPVPKHVALFLQKYMAIHTRKGEPIIDTLTKIEQQLDSTVTQMSWIMAVEKLKLKQQIRRKGRSSNKTSSSISKNITLDHLNQSYNIPENKVQYQQLTKLYNQLVDTHEKLELDCGILFYTFDPSLIEDSAHRIIASVSNWLLNKIENVNRVLRESRQRLEL